MMDWTDTGRRAFKTAVQVGLAILTADAIFGGAFEPSLIEKAAVAATSAAYTVVTAAVLAWASK